MKTIAVAASCLLLNGCFFFYIPGSLTGAVQDSLTGSYGNACVTEGVKAGDKVTTPGGGYATVIKVSTGSARCPEGRIRAEVAYN